MKKVIFGAVAVVVVVALVRLFAFGPSDKQMIQAALDESIQAARDGQSSPVLENISRSFEVNGEKVADRPEIAKMVRSAKPRLKVLNREPQISGDTATIISPVEVDIDYLTFKMNQTIPNVKITFAKESGTRYLVVPYPAWRIVSVEAEGVPNNISM